MENSIFMEFPTESNADLSLSVFGHSITEPLHRVGPSVRTFYLIHFILEGEGDFHIGNTHYHLQKGQGFLIEPDRQTMYVSDKTKPWKYIWVGFCGKEAKNMLQSIGLTMETPIFTCNQGERLKKYVFDMLEHNYSTPADSYRLLGMLYLFLSVIAESQKSKLEPPAGNLYVNHAITYIQNHYSMSVSITEISDYVGVNRSYLSSLFKKYTGLSPIKYLQNFRITRAQHMLRVTDLSIESIALSCGYQSAEAFHKIFHQIKGMSPNTFRQKQRERTRSNLNIMRNNKPEYIQSDEDMEL